MKARSTKLPRWTFILEIVLAVILICVIVVLIFWFRKGYTDYVVDEEVYQFVGGQKLDYESINLHYEEGAVSTEYEDGEVNVNDIPIIYAKSNRMVIPCNMAYVCMHNNLSMKRVNYFTTLYGCETYVNISKDKLSTAVYDGFLYDGKDMYIFLEPMTLYIGDMEIPLGLLSYAKVVYDNYIEYYDSTTDTYKQVSLSSSRVKAVSQSGYTIKLDSDVFMNDSEEYILMSVIDSLPVLKLE